jgi:hypothetical protein
LDKKVGKLISEEVYMPKGKRKERKLPKAGMIFTKRHKGKDYSLTVIEIDGQIKYKIGKNVFNSPTAAAQSLVKYNINGWAFWGMKNF